MKMILGFCSGYFDPLHYGHIQYFQAAKDFLYDGLLTVIVNNDRQAIAKSGKVLMSEDHRCDIVQSIKGVDSSYISIDQDGSVAETLRFLVGLARNRYRDKIYKVYFFNSGDRPPSTYNKKESLVFDELGIEPVYLDLPKLYSSRNFK